MRQDLEGPGRRLCRSDVEGADSDLPPRAWPTSCSRRHHRQDAGRHAGGRAGVFGQLLLLLGTLFGGSFDGGSLEDLRCGTGIQTEDETVYRAGTFHATHDDSFPGRASRTMPSARSRIRSTRERWRAGWRRCRRTNVEALERGQPEAENVGSTSPANFHLDERCDAGSCRFEALASPQSPL